MDDCLFCGHARDTHDHGAGECGVLGCDCIGYDDGSPDPVPEGEVEELELGSDPEDFEFPDFEEEVDDGP